MLLLIEIIHYENSTHYSFKWKWKILLGSYLRNKCGYIHLLYVMWCQCMCDFFIFLSFSTLLNELVAVVILPVSEYAILFFTLVKDFERHSKGVNGQDFVLPSVWDVFKKQTKCPYEHLILDVRNISRTETQLHLFENISYGWTKCPHEVKISDVKMVFWLDGETKSKFSCPCLLTSLWHVFTSVTVH